MLCLLKQKKCALQFSDSTEDVLHQGNGFSKLQHFTKLMQQNVMFSSWELYTKPSNHGLLQFLSPNITAHWWVQYYSIVRSILYLPCLQVYSVTYYSLQIYSPFTFQFFTINLVIIVRRLKILNEWILDKIWKSWRHKTFLFALDHALSRFNVIAGGHKLFWITKNFVNLSNYILDQWKKTVE